jgi:peptidoglycan/LPS O-acetylase OafA/YrhL
MTKGRSGLRPLCRVHIFCFSAWIGIAAISVGILIGGVFRFEGDIMDVPGAIGFFFIIRGLVRSEFRGTLWTGPVQRGLAFMGDRCYTLYLTHLTVIAIFAGIMQRLASRYEWVIWPEFGIGSVVVSLVAIAVAVAVSLPIYRYVELPSHHLARRLCPPKRTPMQAREIVEGKVA